MRILFILENYYPAIGGVETLFKSLIDQLDEQGIECTVMTTRHHDLPKIEKSGHTTIIRYKYFSRYLFTFLAVFPAIRLARQADVIHTTSYNAGLPASLAGKLVGKKVIITFHEVWGKMWFKLPFFSKVSLYFHYLFEQMLLKMPFYEFVAVSEFTASRLLKHGIPAQKIRTIYNGINYEDWETEIKIKKNDNDTFQFIYFGRLGISKGLDILLPAFEKLSQRHINVRLMLILPYNPTGQLDYVKRKIARIDEPSRPQIRHELSHNELQATIKQSDCVVIPSYSEGFGFTAVESMAMGMPIVSSGEGSLAEVISGNFIEMSSHTVSGLVDAMEKALAEKWSYREENKFLLSDTVKQYVKLYEQFNDKRVFSKK